MNELRIQSWRYRMICISHSPHLAIVFEIATSQRGRESEEMHPMTRKFMITLDKWAYSCCTAASSPSAFWIWNSSILAWWRVVEARCGSGKGYRMPCQYSAKPISNEYLFIKLGKGNSITFKLEFPLWLEGRRGKGTSTMYLA